MGGFDQRGQHVGKQINVEGNVRRIDLGSDVSLTDVISQLERIRAEVARSADGRLIDPELAKKASDRLSTTIDLASSPTPRKRPILDHLADVRAMLGTVTATSGLVASLAEIASAVEQVF